MTWKCCFALLYFPLQEKELNLEDTTHLNASIVTFCFLLVPLKHVCTRLQFAVAFLVTILGCEMSWKLFKLQPHFLCLKSFEHQISACSLMRKTLEMRSRRKSDIKPHVEHPFVSPFCQSSSHRDPGTCSHQRSPADECTNRWCWRSRSPGHSSWAGAPGDAEPCRRRIWGLPLGLWYSSTPATTPSPSVTTSPAQTSGSGGRSRQLSVNHGGKLESHVMQYTPVTARGQCKISSLQHWDARSDAHMLTLAFMYRSVRACFFASVTFVIVYTAKTPLEFSFRFVSSSKYPKDVCLHRLSFLPYHKIPQINL